MAAGRSDSGEVDVIPKMSVERCRERRWAKLKEGKRGEDRKREGGIVSILMFSRSLLSNQKTNQENCKHPPA
jgi:hypothetical protein